MSLHEPLTPALSPEYRGEGVQLGTTWASGSEQQLSNRVGRAVTGRRAFEGDRLAAVLEDVCDHVAGGDDADHAIPLDDRDVAVAADGHLVDREGDRGVRGES